MHTIPYAVELFVHSSATSAESTTLYLGYKRVAYGVLCCRSPSLAGTHLLHTVSAKGSYRVENANAQASLSSAGVIRIRDY